LKDIENNLPDIDKNTYLIDTHCHLDMGSYENDLIDVLERADKSNIQKIVTIGISLSSSKQAVFLAQKYKQIYATVGIHPHDVNEVTDNDYKLIKGMFSNHASHIVGYGEIGLDYVKNYSPVNIQQNHFIKQLDLAHELNLPVIIHNREANADTLKLLKKAKPLKHGGIMHCFSGDYDFARSVLDMGLLISIPGIVTFKNATILQDVVKRIPLTSLVLETDGPFLAPHPFRGKRNEPALMLYTAEKIAEIRNISIEEVARQTSLNAEKLFRFVNGK